MTANKKGVLFMALYKGENIVVDMWYGDRFKKLAYGADAFFTPGNGYSGNIYDSNGRIIGDYNASDSTLIEKYFMCNLNE